MVIKVYVSLISFSQEVKKNQQRALMILESKNVPFVTIDITDPGSEESKDYMNENARPKGNNKVPMTPQIFNDAELCGDFEELDMANECDTLGEFLKLTEEQKGTMKIGITSIVPGEENKQKEAQMTNGVSASQEVDSVSNSAPAGETPQDEEAENVNEEKEVANDNEGEAVNEDAAEEIREEEVKENEEEKVEETHEAEVEKDKVEEEAGKEVEKEDDEEKEEDEEEKQNKEVTKEATKDEPEETTKEDNSVTTKSNKEADGEEA